MDNPQDPRPEDGRPPAGQGDQPAAEAGAEQAPERPTDQPTAPAADVEGSDAGEPQAVPRAQEAQSPAQGAGEQPGAPSQGGEPAPTQAPPPEETEQEGEPATRVKPAVPGAHLEVDIVPEGEDPLGRAEQYEDPYALPEEEVEAAPAAEREEREEEVLPQPIASAAIDLAAGARYRATGKRKTAIARVTLRPGGGTYLVNGRSLEEHFPRATLQRNIRQPLETVGYQERMDVVARIHGGGISAQAGALRHGVSRALLEADPNLRGELKRRGFLTRDSRAKERKKAGLKKARKRPQFSKR
jgi:small subunit ribosomal protein S9